MDVTTGQTMTLDGTLLTVNDRADSTGASGDTITCFVTSASTLDCYSNSTAGTKWSDGGTVGD